MLELWAVDNVADKLSQCQRGSLLKTVPVAKAHNVYVAPYMLDLSCEAKHPGSTHFFASVNLYYLETTCITCIVRYGANGKWPSNSAVRSHFGSILVGYESHRESLEIKFHKANPDQTLKNFSVGYVDGHCCWAAQRF